MAMSLTVSAMGVEDYKDANDINFVEAVDVLTEMGILEGTDGVFNATKVLKRAEAAKIISYMMLGKTSADNLKAATAPFADVPATHWAAGYIANCANEGILGGYGNGNFGTEDELTGTQFAKMLLCAVGYGVNGEFSGNGWDVEVKKMALAQGVFEGNLGVNFDAGCTREEAALYAFNTMMNVATVKYSESFGTYYVGNSIFAGENAATTLNTECGYNFKKADDGDVFGREGYSWKNAKGKTVTGLYGIEADATYTKAIDVEDIEDALDAEVAENVVYKVNGEKADLGTSVGGNGVLTEVYVADEKIVKIIEIDTYVGVVGEWDEDEEEAPVTVAGFEGLVTDVEFDEDDIVLVTVAKENAKNKIQSIVLAETFDVEEIDAKTSKYVKLDGEKYNYSANSVAAPAFETAYTVVLDNYGYVIDMVEIEAEEVEAADIEGYVMVLDSEAEVAASTLLTSAKNAAKVKVQYLADGEVEVLDVATEFDEDNDDAYSMVTVVDGKETLVALETGAIVADNTIMGYYMDGAEIVLVDLDETEVAYKLTSGTVEFTGKTTSELGKLNSKTVAYVMDEDDNVETYKGYKNIEFKVVDAAKVLVTFVDDTTLISEIYVVGAAAETETDEVTVYYAGNNEEVDTGVLAVEYYMDGKAYVAELAEGVVMAEEGVYVVTFNEDDEIATAVATGEVEVVTTVKTTYFKTNVATHVLADEVDVWNVTDGIDSDEIAKEDEVIVLTNDNGEVDLIFIVG
jgi:hypothetical protein